jgi:hypothetical protein
MNIYETNFRKANKINSDEHYVYMYYPINSLQQSTQKAKLEERRKITLSFIQQLYFAIKLKPHRLSDF